MHTTQNLTYHRNVRNLHLPRKPNEPDTSYLPRFWFACGQYDFAAGRIPAYYKPWNEYLRNAYQAGFDSAAERFASSCD